MYLMVDTFLSLRIEFTYGNVASFEPLPPVGSKHSPECGYEDELRLYVGCLFSGTPTNDH